MNERSDTGEIMTSAPVRRWAVVALLLMAVLAGFMGVYLGGQASPVGKTVKDNTARTTYLNILSEPHTGRRLVRLKEFSRTKDAETFSDILRLQISVLEAYESRDWAKVADSRFSNQIEPLDKQRILEDYIQNWGIWRHKDMIEPYKISLEKQVEIWLETQKHTPARSPVIQPLVKHVSRYKKGAEIEHMAGEPGGRAPRIIFTPPPAPPVRPSPKPAPVSNPVVDVRIKSAKPPSYPRKAARKHISAVVILSLDIDERGHVARANLVDVKAEKYGKKFVKAAKRAALRSRFHPKTINGKPVARPGYQRQYTFDPD